MKKYQFEFDDDIIECFDCPCYLAYESNGVDKRWCNLSGTSLPVNEEECDLPRPDDCPLQEVE